MKQSTWLGIWAGGELLVSLLTESETFMIIGIVILVGALVIRKLEEMENES